MADASGPVFIRNAQVKLDLINTVSAQTGHREKDPEHIQTLVEKFLDGEFGRTVACGVQLLDIEEGGQKLIDDGVSKVVALKEIAQLWGKDNSKKPDGVAWDSLLRDTFTNGLLVKIVKYPDESDREVREAYNVMKYDQDSLSVAWTTVTQKESSLCHTQT